MTHFAATDPWAATDHDPLDHLEALTVTARTTAEAAIYAAFTAPDRHNEPP